MEYSSIFSPAADVLIGALVAVARAQENEIADAPVHRAVLRGLAFLSLNGEDTGLTDSLIADARSAKERLVPMCSGCSSPCGRTNEYPLHLLLEQPQSTGAGLRLSLLCALQGLARVCLPLWEDGALADEQPLSVLYLGLYALGYPFDESRLQELITDCGLQMHRLLVQAAHSPN